MIRTSPRRRLLGVLAVLAATAALAAGAAAAQDGAPARIPVRSAPADDSLRSLAAPIGLRMGSAVAPRLLDDPAYREIAATQFSSVTPENEMKWSEVEPVRGSYNWAPADRLVAFARANGQVVRGHTLLWHNQVPGWLTSGVADGTIDNTELRALLHRHIVDEVGHFRGQVWSWDVANELFTDSSPSRINPDDFWVSHLGEGIVADAFRWAHQADPQARLYYNDYNIAGEDGSNAKADAVHAWVRELLAAGVPIDGVADQGHLDTQYGFDGNRMRRDLQRYADEGLHVAITEADVRTFVGDAQNQVPTDNLAVFAHQHEFSQMLKACLAVAACDSFTVWGIGDANSWVPGWFTGEGYATLYDVHLAPKPAYSVLQQDLRLASYGAPHRTGPGSGIPD